MQRTFFLAKHLLWLWFGLGLGLYLWLCFYLGLGLRGYFYFYYLLLGYGHAACTKPPGGGGVETTDMTEPLETKSDTLL